MFVKFIVGLLEFAFMIFVACILWIRWFVFIFDYKGMFAGWF